MKLIKLTRGKFAIVDDEDFKLLNSFKWYCSVYGYAVRNVKIESNPLKKQVVYMHRIIMNTPQGADTDHIDRDKLNNQKSNLRICTRTENTRNKTKCNDNGTKYKGVVFIKYKNGTTKARAQISYQNKTYYLGVFKTIEEAAIVYDKKAVELYGEFANTNF